MLSSVDIQVAEDDRVKQELIFPFSVVINVVIDRHAAVRCRTGPGGRREGEGWGGGGRTFCEIQIAYLSACYVDIHAVFHWNWHFSSQFASLN